jgi:hypothetical protein
VFVPPEEAARAYRKFVTEYLLNIPEWSEHVWKEAKISAMRKEAVKYAAATRIAALAKGRLILKRFRRFMHALIRMQAHVRRRVRQKKTKNIVKILYEDWLFRLRYFGATKMQSAIRRYNARVKIEKILSKIKAQEVNYLIQ